MACRKILRPIALALLVLMSQFAISQGTKVTGKVTDSQDGTPVPGVTVTPKGSTTGAQTNSDGVYTVDVPAGITILVFSSVGYGTQEIDIAGRANVDVVLVITDESLGEIVVVGYGTAKKKDLTGAVATVKAKDFNKGVQTAPDQLIQGKVAGVQILNNSGMPGGGTTVRIRGNASVRGSSQPLYVVDGVPLDGRSARPGLNAAGIGNTPGGNPLNFINPADIASMDVLKDASATAIYGSRGANGVVLITTKRGVTGQPKIDFNASLGVSSLMKRLDVLDGDEYRKALTDYGLTSGNYGSDVDALDEVLRNGFSQNYNVAVSGGTENGRYRISGSYFDQQGIVKTSDFKKYTGGITGQFKFLPSKKFSLDYNLIASHITERVAPISNDAGFTGSVIGQALQWNPTHPLYNPDGSIWVLDPALGNTTINPVAMLAAYDDRANTSTILGSISPSYKITNDLEYKFLYSITRSVGVRRATMASWINIENIGPTGSDPDGRGWAGYLNNELTTQQITNTLTYNKQVSQNFHLNALLGHEYLEFKNKGLGVTAQDFLQSSLSYTDYFQFSSQGSRGIFSFNDPSSELQSFFGRVNLNFRDRFLVTGTLRADGSSKFGENNRYGYFPSFAFAWNIHKENFAQSEFINYAKLRLGWGQTGSQEFPSGASQERWAATGINTFARVALENPDLRWETTSNWNAGLDFTIWDNRLSGTIDYFYRETQDLLFNQDAADPVPTVNARKWVNLPGTIVNNGLELTLNATLIRNKDLQWDFGGNVSFLKNEVRDFPAPVPTGGLHGQGISGTTIERIVSDQPLNVFYLRDFRGFDKTTGQAIYIDDGDTKFYLGDPNPDMLLGISTTLSYKKFSFELNMNGAFGHHIYNNTANTVLPIGNLSSRNIAASILGGEVQESLANPITASSRYMEKGDYLKLANATLFYTIGDMGRSIKSASIYLTGQNLFVITNFTGFDPEVNTDKQIDGIPSFGIEYTPYPSARTIIFGVNFSF